MDTKTGLMHCRHCDHDPSWSGPAESGGVAHGWVHGHQFSQEVLLLPLPTEGERRLCFHCLSGCLIVCRISQNVVDGFRRNMVVCEEDKLI